MATETFTRIYLLNYNNYGNRIVKGISDGAPITTISTYKAADPYHKKYDNINFYRNDGVNTTQTINFGAAESEKDADYLIVVKVTKVDNVETDETIVSRWFIIECRYNRRLQMNLTLRRDLIVDYWSAIYTNAVTDGFFCEKGNVSATTDNFIFNNEAMSFNQVLQSGTVMGSGNGYIVGYISKSVPTNIRIYPQNVTVVQSREDIPVYKQWKNGKIYGSDGLKFNGTIYAMDAAYNGTNRPSGRLYYSTISYNGTPSENDHAGSTGTGTTIGQENMESQNLNQAIHSWLVANSNAVLLKIASQLTNFMTAEWNMQPYNDWSYVNGGTGTPGEIYYIEAEQKFWKVTITAGSTYTDLGPIPDGWQSDMNAMLCTEWTKRYNSADAWAFPLANGDMGSCPLKGVTMACKLATVNFTNVTSSYSFGTIPTSRNQTNAPYDIFIGAYNSANVKAASTIANALIGSGAMYDLQHLPWAPSGWNTTTSWSIQGGTFYWLSSDQIAATEITGVTGITYTASTVIKTLKSDSLTKKWRIVAPNHANAWDFNPAQNRGVSKWYYECTFKPYQPYIHVWPQFGGLYGTNYSYDNRGLVFQGSFSMAVSSSAWSTYQINNASYQDAFDRRIENLSVTQDAQRKMELFSMIAGTVSGATSGGYMGANVGGGVGATVGALAGGAVSLAAGLADRSINDALRNEAIDYMKDQFGYQLQNIIATPDTLARSSSFDVNNSVFPVLEQYDATSDEKNALLDKIMRNGMSIGRIGTFKEFWDNATSDVGYIKGKLIRMGASTFLEDTHVFNEIANELYKGVYRY